MAFSKRIITVRFRLGEGQFGKTGANTVEVSGLRISAQISKSGGESWSSATVRIYGLPLEIMNRLTVLNKLAYPEQRDNRITILAGDEDKGASVCFSGIISEAWADFNDMPDTCFLVTAQSLLDESAHAIPATSYKGQVDVVTLLSGIASQMDRGLANNGVKSKMVNPYYSGTALDQLKSVCRDAFISCDVDDVTVTVWPYNGSRDELFQVISSKTGMVGYPMFTQNGILVNMLFDPTMVVGQTITIESSLTPACGGWQISAVTHNIESETPGGEWFTQIECGLFGQVMPIIG